jgi:hypothetical protein
VKWPGFANCRWVSARMSPMKVFPKGWFARILLGSWVLLILGTGLAFVAGALAPRTFDLVTPLWILSIFVFVETFAYVAAFAVRRLLYYLRRWRDNGNWASTIGPLERILIAGWVVFVVAALGSLPLSRYKWVQTFGAEILFSILFIVLLSSTLYGSYMFIRRVREHLSRR